MRALAAYGLGDQRLLPLGVRAEEQDGRVELDELQVGDLRPGPQRERHPVAGGDGGLVVAEKTWPMPPVARTTEGARTAPTPSCWPSPMTCSETPAVRPSASVSRSRTRAFSMVCRAASRTAPTRAREISAPVASPPAWAMRRRWWPPSRVSAMSPLSVVSKCAPVLISRRTASGPSVTRVRTASSSQRPAPATRVSSRCCSGVSPSPSAAAMPPWAQRVEPSSRRALVTTTVSRPAAAQRSAAVSPATPDPTTTTSASMAQPGAGAVSRIPVTSGLRR